MEAPISALTVANAFLEKARAEGHPLTNMQVQKLVFIANGVHLAAFDQPLIHERPRAWTFGPVIPDLYEALRCYGANTVDEPLRAPKDVLDEEAMEAIDATWESYKGWSGSQLSKLSHVKNGPWDKVWNSSDGKGKFGYIPDSLIKDYYKSRVSTQAAN